MKPDAYLLNTARGGIVDEDALHTALQQKWIAGAALDCFAEEPVTQPSRFAQFDNVLLAPHSIAWTEELHKNPFQSPLESLYNSLCSFAEEHGFKKAVSDAS